MDRMAAFLGFLVIVAIGFALSNNRKRVNWKTFGWGIGLQFAFAIMVLRGEDIKNAFRTFIPDSLFLPVIGLILVQVAIIIALNKMWKEKTEVQEKGLKFGRMAVGVEVLFAFLSWNLLEKFFTFARNFVSKIIDFAGEGSKFVFGTLATDVKPVGLVFAFSVLPTIIFVASIFAVMYYLGLMQKIVRVVAKLMAQFMGTSGAESTAVAASIFMGQTEAPLTIKPYLAEMTISELMTMMTAGMAHVSGGIMAAYVMVAHVDIKHLLAAVIMTAPGSIFMSKLMVPEVDEPKTGKEIKSDIPVHDANIIDAAARGASEGGILALNVVAMLVAFISLVALLNHGFFLLHKIPEALLAHAQANNPGMVNFATALCNYVPSSLQQLIGWIFSPLAFVMGVPWKDAPTIGNLMGSRMVINEFYAFIELGKMKDVLDPKSFTIATYALCGFANFSSVAIQIGGIGALAPTRRGDLARLGIKAMIAGTLANYLTATIAGILL